VDYIQLITNWLTGFRRDQQRLKEKITKYKMIESNIEGGPVQYDREKLSATNKVNSVVETKAMALAELSSDIKKIEYRQEFIQNALVKLKPIEQQVLIHKYLHGDYKTWREVGETVDRTDRQCINIKNKAIEKIERDMF
jgi:hypothetical protein